MPGEQPHCECQQDYRADSGLWGKSRRGTTIPSESTGPWWISSDTPVSTQKTYHGPVTSTPQAPKGLQTTPQGAKDFLYLHHREHPDRRNHHLV